MEPLSVDRSMGVCVGGGAAEIESGTLDLCFFHCDLSPLTRDPLPGTLRE